MHPGEKRGVVTGWHLFDRITGRVEHQMLMRVRQAGQQGDVAEVDDVGLGGWHRPGESMSVIHPLWTSTVGRPRRMARPSTKRAADGRDAPVTGHGAPDRSGLGVLIATGQVCPPHVLPSFVGMRRARALVPRTSVVSSTVATEFDEFEASGWGRL